MKTSTKIYLAAAAATAVLIAGAAVWSGYRIRALERQGAEARSRAETLEQKAFEQEAEAAAYREKILFLEHKLGGLQSLARRQDERLEKLSTDSRNARGDVDRARRTGSVPADTAKLCTKLAELGHPCE